MRTKHLVRVAAAALALSIMMCGIPAGFVIAAQQQANGSPRKKPAKGDAAAKSSGSTAAADSQSLSKGDELSEEQAGARDFQLPADDAAKPTGTSDQKKDAVGSAAAKPAKPAPAKAKDSTKAGTPPHSN